MMWKIGYHNFLILFVGRTFQGAQDVSVSRTENGIKPKEQAVKVWCGRPFFVKKNVRQIIHYIKLVNVVIYYNFLCILPWKTALYFPPKFCSKHPFSVVRGYAWISGVVMSATGVNNLIVNGFDKVEMRFGSCKLRPLSKVVVFDIRERGFICCSTNQT